jgi:glycosyltransferase involved in cell wall biosynthesis
MKIDTKTSPELLVVIPVYNEQASIRKVVQEWFEEIENWTENFVFLAINDGSKDESLPILHRLQEKLGNRLEIIDRKNRGHGESCIEGYWAACNRGIPYVFQIDSDGQCNPQYFFRFWRDRQKYDVIYGLRVRRDDGFRRVAASIILKLTLLFFGEVWCADANVPYRLMKTEKLDFILSKIPSEFFLKNVALAVLLKRDNWSENFIPIHFRERYGGEPSVTLGKFGNKAFELIRQLQKIPK